MASKKEEIKEKIKVSATFEEMLQAALERGEENWQTGRYLMTFREGAIEEGLQSLESKGLRAVSAGDFEGQAITLQDVGSADAVVFPEIGSAVVSYAALKECGISALDEISSEGPVQTIEPEYFVFADNSEYLRGFTSAANTIARDLGAIKGVISEEEEEVQVLGATWGLSQCRVVQSSRSGSGIKVAVLDTGFDLGHPEFAGRLITSQTFVGQPVQDLHGHGTHTTGTSCGPRAPPGSVPRYGIAYGSRIFVGKVLSNSGGSVGGSVLAGMNWAIANRCEVINMSLSGRSAPQAAYTQAGQIALDRGLLMIAAAGNNSSTTGSPANSPTIMSVAALTQSLAPASFSNFGKIEISAPGVDVYSSLPRPRLHGLMSGTSMAAPHVTGCAALWAQSSPTLRGMNLWRRLCSSARRLPYAASRVGCGLVQAP